MRPRLLDLMCGAGGCTKGYQQAGFYVVGVDVADQPNYCGDEFYRQDALTVLREDWGGTGGGDVDPVAFQTWREEIGKLRLDRFDAIHASPPCQASANVTNWRGSQANHPELIPETRSLLEASGLPWVIENVPEAKIRADFLLCGSMFGLRVKRHRAFETNWPAPHLRTPCWHKHDDLAFEHKGERAYADAMDCAWMTSREGRQAIPPAFTAFIGDALMREISAVAVSGYGGERP
jgi:hypothetical protein